MPDYLLDTNHVDAYLRDLHGIRLRVRRAVAAGDSFAISTTVLGELYFRALGSRLPEEHVQTTEEFSDSVTIYDFDASAAWEYGKMAVEQKRSGRTMPQADRHIAAVCRARGLTLLTADKHFAMIDDLRVENWLEVEDVEA